MRTDREVADEVVERAWRLGCSVIIKPSEYIDCDGARVGGYFDCDPVIPVLTVAKNRRDGQWLGILLHEYCHLTQWVEGCDAWILTEKHTGNFFEWIGGKSVKNVLLSIRASQSLEADNERRTVRLIRELDAPIDIADYCRRANAYVHFYNVMADKRRWYREPGVLYSPEILEHCNDTIDKDFSKTPKRLYDAIVKYAI
jgi:hypothetical protein